MSAHGYRETLAQATRQFSDGDLEGYLETIYAPDVTLHFLPPTLPQGHQGARLFYGSFMAAFPDMTLVIDDTIVEGDRLAARFHVDMTHLGEFQGIPPTGKRVTMRGVTIMRFEGERVAERWSESDFLGLMQQLGTLA